MTEEADILNQLAGLPSDRYLPKDRYRDFRKLFMGSDEGKRVLREIISWGRLLKSPALTNPIDPYLLAIQYGEQNIVKRLIATINVEPTERPTQSKRSK